MNDNYSLLLLVVIESRNVNSEYAIYLIHELLYLYSIYKLKYTLMFLHL